MSIFSTDGGFQRADVLKNLLPRAAAITADEIIRAFIEYREGTIDWSRYGASSTLVLLSEIKRLHPTEFQITNDGFTQMMGSRWAREAFDRGEDPRP